MATKNQSKKSCGTGAKATVKSASEKVKTTAKNVSAKVKQTASNVKAKAKEYGKAMEQAYNQGYEAGYEAAQNLPKVVGARAAASVGFNNGARAEQKCEKAKKKVSNTKAKCGR